ncbi:MAG: hypothetical protein IT186_07245 [Acidobacteria bacterium]|nr:hypothetical protein [Acidobacteriota bacterium]
MRRVYESGLGSDDAAYFTFPATSTVVPEVFVKVLDFGSTRPFLLFWGGLTDFEYTVLFENVETGERASFLKPAGQFSGGADTSKLRWSAPRRWRVNLTPRATSGAPWSFDVKGPNGVQTTWTVPAQDSQFDVEAGSTVAISPRVEVPALFVGFAGCDAVIDGACQLSVDSDKQVEFDVAVPGSGSLVGLRKKGSGSGTVTVTQRSGKSSRISSALMACSSDCQTGSFRLATTVDILLEAVPDPGSTFVKWMGCDPANSPLCTFLKAGTSSYYTQVEAWFEPVAQP